MQETTWFLAKEEEAEAIASIVTTEEHDPEDWPHLDFPLIQMELMALHATLKDDESLTTASTLEKPRIFDEEDGLLVARVIDSFIQALARVKAENIPALAETWAGYMDQDHEPEQLEEILTELADFARRAVKQKSPVMELSTF